MVTKPILLLVDDETPMHRAMRRTFGDMAEVVAVETCAAALEAALARKGEIKAMLIDHSLASEKTDGLIVTFRQSFGPDFPIFGWSGEETGRARQLAAGCTAVIEKPYDLVDLDIIKEALTTVV